MKRWRDAQAPGHQAGRGGGLRRRARAARAGRGALPQRGAAGRDDVRVARRRVCGHARVPAAAQQRARCAAGACSYARGCAAAGSPGMLPGSRAGCCQRIALPVACPLMQQGVASWQGLYPAMFPDISLLIPPRLCVRRPGCERLQSTCALLNMALLCSPMYLQFTSAAWRVVTELLRVQRKWLKQCSHSVICSVMSPERAERGRAQARRRACASAQRPCWRAAGRSGWSSSRCRPARAAFTTWLTSWPSSRPGCPSSRRTCSTT